MLVYRGICETVFSHEQGKKIKKSFDIARELRASSSQQDILKTFK